MRPSQMIKRKRKKAKQWEFNLKKFRRDLRRYLHTEKSPNYIVLIEKHYYGTFCNWNKGFKIKDTTVSLDTEKTYNSISRVAEAFGLHLDLLYENLYVEDPIKKKHKLSCVKLNRLRWNFKELRDFLCSNTTHKIEDKKRYESLIKNFAEHIRKRYEESDNKMIENIEQTIKHEEELKEDDYITDDDNDDDEILDSLDDEKKPAEEVQDDDEEEEENKEKILEMLTRYKDLSERGLLLEEMKEDWKELTKKYINLRN